LTGLESEACVFYFKDLEVKATKLKSKIYE